MSYFVYMLASKRNGTLYVGVTNELLRRIGEHRAKVVPGFTKRHGVDILVWYETYGDINDAIAREKQIKRWSRKKKILLIEQMNASWKDLAGEWYPEAQGPSTRRVKDSRAPRSG